MKVLHVTASLSLEWGGPVAVAASLAQGLARRNVSTAIFAAAGRRVGQHPIQVDGVATRTFKTVLLARFWTGYAPGLGRALRQEMSQYDLLHIHELWHYPHYAAYRAVRRSGKPYIVTIHGQLDPWALGQKAFQKQLSFKLWQRRILERAAALHAITATEQRQILDQGLATPIAVIPNGIDAQEFQHLPPRKEFQDKHPELAGKMVVLFLGRLHPKKGLDLLAQAFGQIARTRKDVHLVVVGPDEGGYRSKVEAMVRQAGVQDQVTFTGPLVGRDKLAALSAADIFVLPSYSEGFSVTVLEAMACGLPVVISRQCCFPEAAETGSGLVIDTDVQQLAAALMQLVDHPEQRQDMGKRGQQLVQERYTWDIVVDQMLGLYQSVLDRAQAPGHALPTGKGG